MRALIAMVLTELGEANLVLPSARRRAGDPIIVARTPPLSGKFLSPSVMVGYQLAERVGFEPTAPAGQQPNIQGCSIMTTIAPLRVSNIDFERGHDDMGGTLVLENIPRTVGNS